MTCKANHNAKNVNIHLLCTYTTEIRHPGSVEEFDVYRGSFKKLRQLQIEYCLQVSFTHHSRTFQGDTTERTWNKCSLTKLLSKEKLC